MTAIDRSTAKRTIPSWCSCLLALALACVACSEGVTQAERDDGQPPSGGTGKQEEETARPPRNATLAFVRTQLNPAHRVTTVFLANADGTAATRLMEGFSAAFSPAAQHVAISTTGPYVHVIDADGLNERRVAFGYLPVWSPDGTSLLFANREGIVRIAADGTRSELVIPHGFPLSPDPDIEIFPTAWSPDGLIYFQWYHPGNDFSTLFTMKEDGSDIRQLDIRGWYDGAEIQLADAQVMALSHDGSKLAYSISVNGRVLIGSVNADGTDFRIHVSADVPFGSRVAWSADAGRIAFTRYRNTGQGCRIIVRPPCDEMRIWTVDVEGGTLRQLIPESGSPEPYRDNIASWVAAR